MQKPFVLLDSFSKNNNPEIIITLTVRVFLKFMLVLALVVLGVGSAVATTLSNSQAREEAGGYFSNGISKLAGGDIDGAIKEFTISLKFDKKNPLVYYQRAKAYELKNNVALAIADYSQAIAVEPEFIPAHYYCALLYQQNKFLIKAIDVYTRVISMPSVGKMYLANSYNNRGLIFHKIGQLHKALEDFKNAAQVDPKLINVYYNRGCVLVDYMEFDQALVDFNKELRAHPRSFASLHYSRALVFFSQGKYPESWEEVAVLLRRNEQVSSRLILELLRIFKNKNPKHYYQNNENSALMGSGSKMLHSNW